MNNELLPVPEEKRSLEDWAAMATLGLALGPNDAKAKTVREFLSALLVKVWEDQEDFSGKRPWGNSGWKTPVEEALVRSGLVGGEFNNDGELKWIDDDRVNDLVVEAIKYLTKVQE